ncbi:MAG: YgfZ/GcvT domain-containing protein, partial [Nitrososphaerales archaeon]
MRNIPLKAIHQSLGAAFGDLEGWEVPLRYGNSSDEPSFLTRTGFIDLSYFGKVQVSGEEREMFLNALLTNDILPLGLGGSIYSALLDRKGKMLSDMWVLKQSDDFIFLVEPSMESKLIQILNESVISEIVEFKDITNEYGLIGIYGPDSVQTLMNWSAKSGKPISNDSSNIGFKVHKDGLALIKSGRLGILGYDLFFPQDLSKEVWSDFLALGIKPFGLDLFESTRIESGIPRYGIDMGENTIPLEANLGHAISYSKGCYVGQEVISRITHLGQANKRLAQIKLEKDLHKPGDLIFHEGKEVGALTSLNQKTALGYVRRQHAKADTQVQVRTEGKDFSAIIGKII